MKNNSNRVYNEQRPYVTFRTTPEIKERLMDMKKNSNKTLSDATEGIIVNGLKSMNLNGNSKSSNSDGDARYELEQFDGYVQNIKDKAFSEGYDACAVEFRDKINGKPNDINNNNQDDDEETLKCGNCDVEISKDDDYCPDCGQELDWNADSENDADEDADEDTKKSTLSELTDWLSGLFGGG